MREEKKHIEWASDGARYVLRGTKANWYELNRVKEKSKLRNQEEEVR